MSDLNKELKCSPEEWMKFAKDDFQDRNKKGIVNGWSNLKTALSSQIDRILESHNLLKNTRGWDIPSKMKKVSELGYFTPEAFRKLIRNRNFLLHDNVVPNDEPQPYIDLVYFFIQDSNRKIEESIRNKKVSLDDLFNDFKLDLKKQNLSDSTIDMYLRFNKKLLESTKKIPNDITKYDMESFIVNMKRNDVSNKTQTLAKSAFLKFYRSFMRKDITIGITIHYEGRNFRFLSEEQIMQLYKVTDDKKYKLILDLLYGSGMMLSDCLKLKIDSLDMNKKLMKFRRSGGCKIAHHIILPSRFKKDFEEYLQERQTESKYLFSGRGFDVLSKRAVQKKLRKLGFQIGIKDLSPRILRNTFEQHMNRNNVSFNIIQYLLGKSTKKYGYNLPSLSELEKINSSLDSLKID